MSTTSSPATTNATPQQIGKAFVVQYYRLLHEHPESLHRFYSSSSTFMHDDPLKTVTGTEAIAKRIEELSLKSRHVKIRQVDCHSTVGSSVVVQVCGEISSSSVNDSQTQPIMKRFVQTFVLTPADNSKQKYYVHNDIFRYQDSPTSILINDNTKTSMTTINNNEVTSFESPADTANSSAIIETPITPSAANHIEFFDNTIVDKKEGKPEKNVSSTLNITPPITPVVEQAKEQTSKPKSYRDAIGKKEKPVTTTTSTEIQPASPPSTSTTTPATPAVTATTPTTAKSNKSNKQQKKAAAKSNGNNNTTNRAPRGHPQDANDYYDDSWYYGNVEEGYLSTGYTDDQEIFVGNLSAQVTENEIHELFRPYGSLLLVRIGNTGSQVGAANFAFVVCQSIEMAKAIVTDHENLMKTQKINVEAKKRRPFPHTFRPTYPTAASPTSYQSTGYPAASFYNQSYYEGVPPTRGARRGAKGGTK
ncbi:unnamed protein product [Adineta steineri]|uniref:Uncharacterized protein n=2 Tax=Adineta steineri TaxID=433720 RepID=A0A815DHS5_9BILA|nr:unnamed protein product [Adineta steineri]CAF1301781.1 unnamed protein product [Adineta steineri]CAF3493483.1 unnamed protein product [Adineta steineri]CAF3564561.1 unnamed protein product [Adineta steineri]CAF3595527.1 unnamed protein product [Adineta steineri]